MSDEEKKQPLVHVEDTLGLSKPGTALVEKSSAGLGGLLAPFLAKQRAKARKIDTASELSDLQERTEFRLICQETRKQKNIESIIKQAVEELPLDASVENIQKMDEDWIAHLFKHCDIVSDKEMQILWARILTGEANKTGTFSKRTIDIVSKLDKEDAKLFTTFCQFVWQNDDGHIALIYRGAHESNPPIYQSQGIDFNSLEHLESMDLIRYSPSVPIASEILDPEHKTWHYHNISVKVKGQLVSQPDKYQIPVGYVILTQMGRQLAPVSGANRNDEFFNYVIGKWKREGHNPIIQNPATE